MKDSDRSLSELVAVEIERFGDTHWDMDLVTDCNLSFFLGMAGFAKRTFLYQILMCESIRASLLNQE